MTGSKFKVGDVVRRTAPYGHGGVSRGECVTVTALVEGGRYFLTGREAGGDFQNPDYYELVDHAPKSVTIAHIIPLIKDARQLDNAAHVVCDRGGDTTLMDKMLTSLYAEIGEKVARAVEVDA